MRRLLAAALLGPAQVCAHGEESDQDPEHGEKRSDLVQDVGADQRDSDADAEHDDRTLV